MAERLARHKHRERTDTPEPTEPAAAVADAGGRLKNDLDDLLDEIDDVLESNAEEFVRSYVQKGGE